MPKGFVNNRSYKGSLYSLVFRGYIIFVLLGVLIVLLMLYISDYFNNKYSQAPDINELLKNAQFVEQISKRQGHSPNFKFNLIICYILHLGQK